MESGQTLPEQASIDEWFALNTLFFLITLNFYI